MWTQVFKDLWLKGLTAQAKAEGLSKFKPGDPQYAERVRNLAIVDNVVLDILSDDSHLANVSLKINTRKGGKWEVLLLTYDNHTLKFPMAHFKDLGRDDIEKKARKITMKTMVEIVNNMLKVEHLSIDLANFPDGIDGMEILSPSYALITFETYTRILLAGYYLSLLSSFHGEQTFAAAVVTAHWNHEDSSGIYLEMSKLTPLGLVSLSISCWDDESSANMDLLEQFNKQSRSPGSDRTISLESERANMFWNKKVGRLIAHVGRAEKFSWDNTPEAYWPNREVLEGGKGFQLSGLYPYSFGL